MSNGMTPKEAGILGLISIPASIGLWFVAEHQEQKMIEETEIIYPTHIEQPFMSQDDD